MGSGTSKANKSNDGNQKSSQDEGEKKITFTGSSTHDKKTIKTIVERSMLKHLTEHDGSHPSDVVDFQIVNIQEGNRIFRLSELTRSLFVLIEGECKIICDDKIDFLKREIAVLRKCDMFGLNTPKLLEKNTPIYIVATEGCLLAEITSTHVIEKFRMKRVHWMYNLDKLHADCTTKEGFSSFNAVILRALKKTHIFNDWNDDEILKILTRLKWGQLRFMPRNTTLCEENEYTNSIYILLLGSFKLTRNDSDARYRLPARRFPLTIGEEQAFNKQPFDCNLVASGPTFVLPLSVQLLEDAVSELEEKNDNISKRYWAYVDGWKSIHKNKQSISVRNRCQLQAEVIIVQLRQMSELRNQSQINIYQLYMRGVCEEYAEQSVVEDMKTPGKLDWIIPLIGCVKNEVKETVTTFETFSLIKLSEIETPSKLFAQTSSVILRVPQHELREIVNQDEL